MSLGLARFRTRHAQAVSAVINARSLQQDEYELALKIFQDSGLPFKMDDINKVFEEADKQGGLT